MNGNPPENDQGYSGSPEPPAPPAPPSDDVWGTPPAPTVPPQHEPQHAPPPPPGPYGAPQVPPPGAGSGPVGPPPQYGSAGPVKPPRPKIDWVWFSIGFFGPVFIGFALGALTAVLPIVTALTSFVSLGILIAGFVLWIYGRNNGDNRMRSLGLGILWLNLVGLLVALLIFGSCLLLVGTGQFGL